MLARVCKVWVIFVCTFLDKKILKLSVEDVKEGLIP